MSTDQGSKGYFQTSGLLFLNPTIEDYEFSYKLGGYPRFAETYPGHTCLLWVFDLFGRTEYGY